MWDCPSHNTTYRKTQWFYNSVDLEPRKLSAFLFSLEIFMASIADIADQSMPYGVQTVTQSFYSHFRSFSSVQFSSSVMSDSLQPHELQHARPPCPSPTPRVHPNPFGQRCCSVIPFSSCPQSFPASGSFQRSQLFPSGGQSIGVSVSTSVLSVNTQDWSPLEWTGWISLQCKGLSRVFSNTTVQKHQFFSPQLSF